MQCACYQFCYLCTNLLFFFSHSHCIHQSPYVQKSLTRYPLLTFTYKRILVMHLGYQHSVVRVSILDKAVQFQIFLSCLKQECDLFLLKKWSNTNTQSHPLLLLPKFINTSVVRLHTFLHFNLSCRNTVPYNMKKPHVKL